MLRRATASRRCYSLLAPAPPPPSPALGKLQLPVFPVRSNPKGALPPPLPPTTTSTKPVTQHALRTALQTLPLTDTLPVLLRQLRRKSTLVHWLGMLRTLLLTPSLGSFGDKDAIAKALFEALYSGKPEKHLAFKHALDVYCECNASLKNQVILKSAEASPDQIVKLRLESMQKGVNGSRVLELSSANPPLWLERGRVLVLTTPDKRRDLVFGYVSSARYKNMHGAFELTTCNALPEDNWTPPCRVEGRTLDINLTSYFVMLDALKKRAYSIQPGSISPITDVTLPTNTPSNPIDTRNYTYNLLHPLSSLNASQSLAVETALTQRVSLIHGGPGSGKTHTIVALISKLLHTHPKQTILVTAPTNQAVDSILSHFLATHSRNPEFKPNWGTIFRVGVRDQVLPAHHAYLPHSETRPAESRIDKRVYFAKLVFSTTLGGGLSVIASRKFDTVIVDEAAQVSHCVARVSVVKAKERCILVGDDKQLGPVTSGYNQTVDGENTSGVDHSNSSDGSEVSVIDDDRVLPSEFHKSLFEMHREDKRIPVVLLDEQYRMPKELMEFSNQTWYDGKIKSHSSTAKSPLQSPPFHGKKFIRFVNVDHGKETVGSESINGSVCNSAEAHLVKGIIESLWKEVKESNIGVISGYAAQVNLIRQVLGEVGLNFVDVRTVDGFQGQERDVIIFSAVKTNGNLGFLKDYRRLNVMLTRARRGIIILGHEKTLRMDPVWSRLLDSI